MSILAIGQSSFLAQSVKKLDISKDWNFLGHGDALQKVKWPEKVKTVVCFSCDPKVKKGEYSDFDYKVAKMAKKVGARYVMLSSRAVYGVSPKLAKITEEQAPYDEITPYGRAKRQIEDGLLKNFDHVTILRLSNVFGAEYGLGQDRSTFFGLMLKSLKEEGEIRLSMSETTQKDFLPVAIFAEYLSIIAHNPKSGVYNVGAGIGTPVGYIAKWVIEGFGEGKITQAGSEVTDSFVLDMTKTRSAFSLKGFDAENIRKMCVQIGRELRE